MPWVEFIDTLSDMILHFLFSLAFTATPSANATSFYIRPFSEFTQSTPNIARGRIHGIHTENSITADGARTIYTYANLEVTEVLKGDLHQKSNVTVRKIGGTKDGMTLEVPSSPEFKEEEDTVVFLSTEKEDQSYEVLGLELGKFGLVEKNGEFTLSGGIFNYSKPGADGGENDHSQRAKDLTENEHPWSLSQLRALIRKQNPDQAVTGNQFNSGAVKTPTSRKLTAASPIETKEAQIVRTQTVLQADRPDESSHFWIYCTVALVLVACAFLFLRKK